MEPYSAGTSVFLHPSYSTFNKPAPAPPPPLHSLYSTLPYFTPLSFPFSSLPYSTVILSILLSTPPTQTHTIHPSLYPLPPPRIYPPISYRPLKILIHVMKYDQYNLYYLCFIIYFIYVHVNPDRSVLFTCINKLVMYAPSVRIELD